MKNPTSRRSFLKSAAALSAGLALPGLVPASALGRAGRLAAGDRITLGFIGVGGMGSGHLNTLVGHPEVEILAVCDVDSRYRDAAREKVGGDCAAYTDYRALLDRADIDAVVIATPDHWHTLTSLHACEAGKDIYCEKPLTLTIEEGRVLMRAVRRYGRVFQTGSQQRSSGEFHRACSLVRNGCLGEITKVEVGIAAGPVSDWVADGAPPPEVDWNLWLGPAPKVPFNRLRHPYNFRWFFDYSGGKMTDWGAHHNDIARWGLGLDEVEPVSIEAAATFPTTGLYDTAVDYEVTYEYAGGERIVCSSKKRHGIRFEGEDGWLHVDRGVLQCEPAELKDLPLGNLKTKLFRSPGHHQNWIDCMRSRNRPICDVEIGARSVTVCHLGNIAMRTGRKLEWNGAESRFVDDENADRWVSKPYRAPWHL